MYGFYRRHYFIQECADLASSRGHNGTVYGFFAAAMTWGLFMIGVAAGYILLGDDSKFFSSFFGMAGYGLGALISWIVTVNLENKITPYEPTPFPRKLPTSRIAGVDLYENTDTVWCIRCGKELAPGSKTCDACGMKVPTLE